MVLLRDAAVVVLACAVVAAGFGPVDHLHPATDVRSAVVHAHVEGAATATDHEPAAVDDGHGDAVQIRRAMAGGQERQLPPKPPVAPAATWLPQPDDAGALPLAPEIVPTASPPARPSAPRAPPA